MYWYVKVIIGLAILAVVVGTGAVLHEHFGVVAQIPSLFHSNEAEAAPTDSSAATASSGLPKVDPLAQKVRQKLQIAHQHMQKQDPVTARNVVENILKDPEVETWSEQWREAGVVLSEINSAIIESDVPSDRKVSYTVKSGDSLWEIARAHNTTVALVQRSNKLNPDNPVIFPGQVLHIYRGDWRVVVSKTQRILQLLDGDRLVKTYEVGIGRQDRTPVGKFVVYNKEVEPVWNPPGRIIPFGDPDNVLGTRWMGLKPVGDTDPDLKGYGIHGTWDPDSIGKAMSNGCIRMRNEDVENLFVYISEGCPVAFVE